ncbi:MAG: Gfo/Idh/MocA family oxidoreductase [Phycisphaerales bacterium]|nr:Gfo/Idh/MocA family oxidoreductase [Phycisphaerales bacterium]MCB9835468.1 Gfo/Idh/MocA family oxidoreductase [Phycisphaera sp.]
MNNRREFLVKTAGGLAAAAVLPELGFVKLPDPRAGLRVGVIGAGRQGRSILGELTKIEGAEVTAVCDVDDRRMEAGLRRSAGAEGFADVAAMLASGKVDAVAIAVPTHAHPEVARQCIEAGVHVFLDGPLANTVEGCNEIVTAARSAKGVVASGLQGRSNPVYKLARTFYRSDSVRDLVALRAQQNQKTSWRTPASDPARDKALNWRLDPEVTTGLAGEWGTQQFDVFNWYTERYPVKVSGSGSIRLHKDGRTVHDTIACTLTYEDGAVLQYQATLANSYEGAYEVLYGTNAAIKLGWSHGWMFKESDAPTQGWEVYANRQQFHNDEGITLIADATKLASQGKLKEGIGLPNPSLYYALGDFVACATTGETPACVVEEAARATAIGIAAHKAITTGTEQSIDL